MQGFEENDFKNAIKLIMRLNKLYNQQPIGE